MKFSKEARVGLLAIVTLSIFYFGFNFLKGSDLFSTENTFTTYYKDVTGLKESNPVSFNGVTVGRVMKVLPEQGNGRVKVIFTVNDEITITDNTIALLNDADLLGSKEIKLMIPSGGKPAADEAVLRGETKAGLVASTMQRFDPTLQKVDSLVATLNTVIREYENSGVAMQALIASATQTTNGINGIVAQNSRSLQEVTSNAAVLTASLNTLTKDMNQQIKPILSKTDAFAQSLNELQLQRTVSQLNTTVGSLQSILKDINQGQGTLGKLTQDEALYRNLNATTASLNALLIDLKASPKRYVHFSLFGQKDKNKKGVTTNIDESKLANPVMLDTLQN